MCSAAAAAAAAAVRLVFFVTINRYHRRCVTAACVEGELLRGCRLMPRLLGTRRSLMYSLYELDHLLTCCLSSAINTTHRSSCRPALYVIYVHRTAV